MRQAEAAVKIQGRTRAILARRTYLCQRESAVLLQSACRGWTSRRAICFPESDRGSTPGPLDAPPSPPPPSSSALPAVSLRMNQNKPAAKTLVGGGRLSVGAIRTSGWTDKDDDIIGGLQRLKRRKHKNIPRLLVPRHGAGSSHDKSLRNGSAKFKVSQEPATPAAPAAQVQVRGRRVSGDVPVRIKQTPPLSATREDRQAHPNASVDGHLAYRVKRADGFLPPVPDAAAAAAVAKKEKEEKKPAWNSLFGVQQQYESNGISVRNRNLRKRYL